MIVNNLYDKLPWRTKIYGIGIYGVSCSTSVVVSVDRSVVAVVVCFSVAEAVSVDRLLYILYAQSTAPGQGNRLHNV